MKIGNFEITADKYNFILSETYEGKDKQGNPKTQVSDQRYYGRLEDALQAIVTRGSADAIVDADLFFRAMANVRRQIADALKEQNIPTRKAA